LYFSTPEDIRKTGSHGCIRLTNWDAAAMARPGTVVRFEDQDSPVAPLSVPVSEGQRLKSQRNSLNRRRRCSNALLLSFPGAPADRALTENADPGGGVDFEERSCWLAPVQIVVCTITGDADEFALAFAAKAKKRGLRVETDLRNEKINYKVREHSLARIPALIAVGSKEASENTVSVRRLGSNAQSTMGADEAIAALAKEAMPPDLREAG
jgi:hypothetical protein